MEKTAEFWVEGMSCESCEKIIKKQAMQIQGVKSIEIDHTTQKGRVVFDDEKTNIDEILFKIEEKGYECLILNESAVKTDKKLRVFGWVIALIGILVAGYFILRFAEGIELPTISSNMGLGLLFLVGLLTGFHCVAMCGGFVVSYTANNAKKGKKSHLSHIAYGSGKLISYTVIGAVFGLLGSIIAFTPLMRGIVGIIAGLFLIIFGLSMFGVFPFLRKIRLRMPGSMKRIVGEQHTKNSSPFIIGLLNGLMIACGPLQAVYIMAAGTGSMVEGAKMLFVFGLGTLPVMLGFGYLTSFISAKATHKILKFSGVIVILLGLIMLNRGLALTGGGYSLDLIKAKIVGSSGTSSVLNKGVQEIEMQVDSRGYSPNFFVLKKGIPVKWKINVKELTGCNNEIIVPSYNLDVKLKMGENVVEFTPNEEGVVTWSCWMGMLKGNFIVSESGNASQEQIKAASIDSSNSSAGCGCGMH